MTVATPLDCLKSSRLLTILRENMLRDLPPDKVGFSEDIQIHIDHFLAHHGVSTEQAVDAYTSFLSTYGQDLKRFAKTGKYPLEIDPDREHPDILSYQLALLFSTLCYRPRFDIMDLFRQTVAPAKRATFIGCGPGLEMAISADRFEQVEAYDPSVGDFLPKHFPSINFHADYFNADSVGSIDAFILIELLEHLSEPYALLADCAALASKGAKAYLTTATNLPQFDHLYNFEADHSEFEARVAAMGFEVEVKEEVLHEFKGSDITAMNTFYVLQKS